MKPITKSDYIIYRECPKNAWLRIHKPEVFYAHDLSEFDQALMDTGNEVEELARKLYPDGILIDDRDEKGQRKTQELLDKKHSTIFQPVFEIDGFLAACDILQYDKGSDSYIVTEIKATNDVKPDKHLYDLAFQVALLRRAGLTISRANLMHLNREYVRQGELDLAALFKMDDVTDVINQMVPGVITEMETAKQYLSAEAEPEGHCSCVFKGKNKHCTTFAYNNPDIPEYSVHNIARIGASKKKLIDLIDSGIYTLDEIEDDFDLTEIQRNQVDVHKLSRPMIDRSAISRELNRLTYPLYFLDYETFPCAIPRFDSYSPYNQIPFQFSLHILESPESELKHEEFLHEGTDDPAPHFAKALKQVIGESGNILVWNKTFECGVNDKLAKRLPEHKPMMDNINSRIFDLEEVFKKQLHVHPGFKGKTSIKYVLPTLVPELSYKDMEIQEGATASQKWKQLVDTGYTNSEKQFIAVALKEYCALDTYAMYATWKHLNELARD